MKKFNFVSILFSFLLLGSLKAVTPPSGILYYVPITIQNTQTSATPNPFQQMIQVNVSKYSAYMVYNNSFANFEFFYENGTIIPAWIESYSAPILTIWVKIKSIPASSSLTIYLGFASKSTNLLSSSGTSGIGEAPQLSPTYAQYDDGASVFNNYWNFAGTSLPSSLTKAGTATVTVNNGLTIGVKKNGGLVRSTSSITYPQIVDTLITTAVSGTVYVDIGEAKSTTAVSTNNRLQQGYSFEYYNSYLRIVNNSADTVLNSTSGTITANHVYSFAWAATGNERAYYDYTQKLSSTDNVIAIANYYIFVGAYYSTNTLVNIKFQWLRTRAYPPNNVMPSVSFGSVTTFPPTISISPPPNYTYPNPQITIQGTCTGTDTCAIYLNGVQKASASGSVSYTITGYLAAGTYNATVKDLSFNLQTEQNFVINKGWTKITISDPINKIVTANYSTTNTTLAIAQKLLFNLYVNGNLVNSTNTANILKVNIASYSGTITIKANVTGNENFTSNSTTRTFTFAQPTISISPLPPYTYPNPQITINAICATGDNCTLYLNGDLLVWNITKIRYTISQILAAGTYNLTAKDLSNLYQTEQDFTINKAWVKITISHVNTTVTATYSTTNVALAISQKLQFNLYVNGVLVNSTNTGNVLKTYVNLNNDPNVTAEVLGNANFSANSTTRILARIYIPRVYYPNRIGPSYVPPPVKLYTYNTNIATPGVSYASANASVLLSNITQTINILNVTNVDSRIYYMRLLLVTSSSTIATPLTANLTLVNSTTKSSLIQIQNGVVISQSTNQMPIQPNSNLNITLSGYYSSSGYVSTLNILLEYCTLLNEWGVCTYYPIKMVVKS
jgi:uncharacterized protein YdbL (DUF1318 family)